LTIIHVDALMKITKHATNISSHVKRMKYFTSKLISKDITKALQVVKINLIYF